MRMATPQTRREMRRSGSGHEPSGPRTPFAVVAILAAVAVAVAWLSGRVPGLDGWDNTGGISATSESPPSMRSPSRAPVPVSLESRMMVVGDVFWGRYVNDWAMADPAGFAYPFQRLSDFDREAYDAWINDMECPITDNPKVASSVEDDTLQFDCDPRYLTEASKWFDVMTLANNHTDNQGGLVGLEETRRHLDEHGIQYFGSFDPEDRAHLCDIIAMPARATMSDGSTRKVALPMAWCGFHGVFATPSDESLAVIKGYTDHFPVIAMPHSGQEYQPGPDEIKTTFYRTLIDNGADAVIGDHPHWVQASEAYKGRPIIYSLGNFIFDQQFNSEVTRSAVVTMEVSTAEADPAALQRWIDLAGQCTAYGDSCVAQAREQDLPKLPLTYHFTIDSSDNSGGLVKRGTAEQTAAVKERLAWAETVSGLRSPYAGR